MGRFFVFLMVVGGTSLIMFTTRPSRVEYLSELQRRADVIAAAQMPEYVYMRGGDPLDEMVAAQSPSVLLEQTEYTDLLVFTMFSTEYNAPGYGRRRVRTYGMFSTFVSSKVR